MAKKYHLDLKHILENRKITLSVIVLSLVIVFIFILGNGGEQNFVKTTEASDFVIGSDENVIQPSRNQMSEPVISEGSFDFTANCNDYIETSSTAATSTDILVKRIYAPILMYHYIEYPGSSTLPWLFHNTDIFEAQLKTIKKNCYQTFFQREVAEAILTGKALPGRNIALTFDDGYADWYYNVFPLLKKYQAKATMFIIVNAVGTPGYLTQAQMKEMLASGYVEFGSHTLNHINLRQSSWQKANWEIAESKKQLEQMINAPVYSFAYPYGFFNERDEKICQTAGYLSCASTYPGSIQSYNKRYALYRLRPGYRIADDFMIWLEKTDHIKTGQ